MMKMNQTGMTPVNTIDQSLIGGGFTKRTNFNTTATIDHNGSWARGDSQGSQ